MENIIQKTLEEIVKNLDYIIFQYLTSTITGVAILIVFVIIILGIITISYLLKKIANNQEVIFEQLKEQMITQNKILDLMYEKINESTNNKEHKN